MSPSGRSRLRAAPLLLLLLALVPPTATTPTAPATPTTPTTASTDNAEAALFALFQLFGKIQSAATANHLHTDLLPIDCGRREVTGATNPFIVGTGDTSAYYGEFPYQARLTIYSSRSQSYVHHCGAIIITDQHLLTAAHCVVHVVATQLEIHVGDMRLDTSEAAEQILRVAGVDWPVEYFGSESGMPHDVALIQVSSNVEGPPIKFGPYVQPACLPLPDLEYETALPCQVSGWGRTSTFAPISEVLRGVTVPLVSDSYCVAPQVYGNGTFHPGLMVCAGLTGGGADSCEGDSGGPLACQRGDSIGDPRFTAYGVVSSGDPDGCALKPGLYTKLSYYVPWLLRQLQADQPNLTPTSRPAVTDAALDPVTPAPSACPSRFVSCAGHCYQRLDTKASHSASAMLCFQERAILAVPRSRQENVCVANLAKDEEIWLGVTDRAQEGVWYGADGALVPADAGHVWGVTQPDDFKHVNTSHPLGEDCVEVGSAWVDNFAEWNDEVCALENHPMCQWRSQL